MKIHKTLSTLFLSFFFLQLALNAEQKALHQYIDDSPLVYARVPFSWDNNKIFNENQNQKVIDAVLRNVTKPGNLGQSLRGVLGSLRGQMEFMVVPNQIFKKDWPIPSYVLRGKTNQKPEKFMNMLVEILKEYLAHVENKKVKDYFWIKFKKKPDPKKIVYKGYVMFWHLWVIMEGDNFTIMASPSDMKFNKLLDKVKRERKVLEGDSGIAFEDLFIHADVARATDIYKPHLMKNLTDVFNMGVAFDVFKMNKLKIYSKDSGKDFKINLQLSWLKDQRVFWQSFADQNKSSSVVVDGNSDFVGSFKLPMLKQNEFNRMFYAFSPKNSIKGPAYYRLYSSLGDHLSFSWNQKSIAPVFRLPIKNPKVFNKEFRNVINMYAKVNMEKDGKREYYHIVWADNTVSYYIEGNALYFSPLLHGLKDYDNSRNKSIPLSKFAKIQYPSKGNVTNAYYAMIHVILNSYLFNNKGVNPNDFPAFSKTSISPAKWSGLSAIEMDMKSETLDISWHQPYGLPGLIAGSNVPSSAYISFLTLLSLTVHSF